MWTSTRRILITDLGLASPGARFPRNGRQMFPRAAREQERESTPGGLHRCDRASEVKVRAGQLLRSPRSPPGRREARRGPGVGVRVSRAPGQKARGVMPAGQKMKRTSMETRHSCGGPFSIQLVARLIRIGENSGPPTSRMDADSGLERRRAPHKGRRRNNKTHRGESKKADDADERRLISGRC